LTFSEIGFVFSNGFMVHRSLFIVAAFGGFGCGFLFTMGVGELKIGVAGGHVG